MKGVGYEALADIEIVSRKPRGKVVNLEKVKKVFAQTCQVIARHVKFIFYLRVVVFR